MERVGDRMNTHTFHRQATVKTQLAPAVSASELASMNDRAHAIHVDQTMRWVAGIYLETPPNKRLAAAMDMTVAFNESTLSGSKTILGLSGPNTAGKSTLTHRWSAQYYRRAVQGVPLEGGLPRCTPEPGVRADLAPVVWINLQSKAKIAEVDAQILDFLRAGVTGTIRDMTLRTVRALARHQVRILIIDDVHLLDTRSVAGRGVLDHIKHLNTELGEIGATLILVGADLHLTQITQDSQIADRMQLLTLAPIPAKTIEGREEWKQLLADIEPQLMPVLPTAHKGFLSQDLAKVLHQRTGGFVGELSNVLKHAAIASVMQRDGSITEALVARTPMNRRNAGYIDA